MTSSTPPLITAKQLQLLQLLLRRHVHAGATDDARRARLAFIGWLIDRDVDTSRDLTRDEASHLIDALMGG